MISFSASSTLPIREILKRAEGMDALVMRLECAQSMEELELAAHLAQKSCANGTALAKKMKYEFLLWLTGKTDIRSAMRKSLPDNPKELLIVSFKEGKARVLDSLEASELHKALPHKAESLRLEEISLSRIKN